MSLVAYASSEESEPDEAEPEPEEEEEEEEAAAPTSGHHLGGMFASLPAPKGQALLPPPPQMLAPQFPPPLLLPPPAGDPRLQPPPPLPFGLGGFPPPPGLNPAETGEGLGLVLPAPRGPGLSLPPPVGGAGPPLGLPKPKKRTEPVKIAVPELHQGDVSIGAGGSPSVLSALRAWAPSEGLGRAPSWGCPVCFMELSDSLHGVPTRELCTRWGLRACLPASLSKLELPSWCRHPAWGICTRAHQSSVQARAPGGVLSTPEAEQGVWAGTRE